MAKVSSLKMKAKEVYMVGLKLKMSTGSKTIPIEWLGVNPTTDALIKKKMDSHVDEAKVHLIPEDIRRDLSNFRQNVKNSAILRVVPVGFGMNNMKLMSKTMLEKAQAEFDEFNIQFDKLVSTIDKNYSKYEKDFYQVFNTILKGNPEKDAIIREIKLMMPSKDVLLSGFDFEFKNMPLPLTASLESRFIGKALGAAYRRTFAIEKMAFKNGKVDMRTLGGIGRDQALFKDLEVDNISMIKGISDDFEDLIKSGSSGKVLENKAVKIREKIKKHTIKIGAFDLVM